MKSIKETIEYIFVNIRTDLPAILTEKQVKNFDAYFIGYPYEQDVKTLCVRFASYKEDRTQRAIEFTIHLALPGVEEADVMNYIDAVKDYFDHVFDPVAYDSVDGTYAIDMTDDYNKGSTEVYFSVTLTGPHTDCD